MEKEMNVLQDKFSAGEYLAPRVKVAEIKARRVICTSGQLGSSTWEDGSWQEAK